MGGHRTRARHSRRRAAALGLFGILALASLSSCGGDSSAENDEPAGTYEGVEVAKAEFPTEQQLGQTSLLRLRIRNGGEERIPALTVTTSIGGKAGQTSSLPFGIHNPQPGLAQPDRPVWVLSAHYPKRGDSPEPGGATTSNQKTFDFGALKPGAAVEGVWKLSAVRTGRYKLLYEVGVGVTGQAKAETPTGVTPGGSFAVRITSETPDTEVTDSGRVVEIEEGGRRQGKRGEGTRGKR